ncbi:ABC transporter substrate-binding protein, partial [Sinorhizobium meliloti]|uniref:ABC transporter substrate-binding protein n=1 Tax=Rhizobium meliloti TaxID=382 RepID=UPI000FE0FDD2
MFNHVKTSCRALLASAVLFAGMGAALAETTLKVVPSADLQVLDPMGATADLVKMHGFMIYDTLYALDEHFKPQPQMVQDMTLSEDKKTYRFTLRDGLKWHDSQPVKAEDCVASLKRWQQRDAAGQLMARQLKEMRVVDDKTFELEFNEPYGIVLESLSKVASNIPFMMPKRVAETDAYKEITDYTGPGPYKFAKDKWVPGSKVVYEKFADYVQRSEPANAFAAGIVNQFELVHWTILKAPTTVPSV